MRPKAIPINLSPYLTLSVFQRKKNGSSIEGYKPTKEKPF
jgi:hypothetical protein